MFVVTEKTVEVLRWCADQGMTGVEAAKEIGVSRSHLRNCAIRDGHWDEIKGLFPMNRRGAEFNEAQTRANERVGELRHVHQAAITAIRSEIPNNPATRWLIRPWRQRNEDILKEVRAA